MPRQIIDTESSRPRYVRRIVLTIVVAAIVLAALIYLAFTLWGHRAVALGGGNGSPARVSWQPRIPSPAGPLGRSKENPCFVA